MSLGTWLTKAVKNVGSFLSKAFTTIKDDADVVAISITEGIKGAIADGLLPAIADLVDATFHTSIGAEVVTVLNNNIAKILAIELAIQGLPDSPTEADIKTFGDNVIKAITGLSPQGKSKLYTTLAAQVYGLIETEVNKNEPVTFAELVADVEQAYADYTQDQADENNQDEAAE